MVPNLSKITTSMGVAANNAWNKRGIMIDKATDAASACMLAGQQWKVTLEKIQVVGGLEVPDRFAVVRDDTGDPLDVVGTKYTALQNQEGYDTANTLVVDGEATYESAGVIGKGQKVWILMKRPDSFEVVPGDKVDTYVAIVNSHDGQSSLAVMPICMRLVSNGTLNIVVDRATNYMAIRHTSGITERVQDLKRAIGITKQQHAKLRAACISLAQKQLTQQQVDAFLDTVMGAAVGKNASRLIGRREDVLKFYEYGTGNDLPGVKGTAWAMLNGLVEWVDYERPTRLKAGDKQEQRTKSMLFGSGRELKQLAFDTLLKL
jgi:phage/plasmid-like protein (TIGR03299 family)